MPKLRNFRSKEAYHKWLSFKHIHLPDAKRTEPVRIHGKIHYPEHEDLKPKSYKRKLKIPTG